MPPLPSLPSEMERNYGQLRELDLRFTGLQKQMETQCGHAVQDPTLASNDGGISSDVLILEHSKSIASVQKECLRIAEAKLAVAVQTYELVDSYIQQLDVNYRKYEEECRRQREATPGPVVDPNEPTYCYCNQSSYGPMIACYNPKCKFEWFHLDCVGIKKRPKGKWSCPECSSCKRRRGK